MKKLFLLLSLVMMLSSCGKSDEGKLNDMIAEATKSSLYIPESYDPVSTQCDTLGRDIINSMNIKKSAKIISLVREAQDVQSQIESDMEQRDYWRGKYGGFYSDYSKKVRRGEEKRDQLKSQANDLFAELLEDYNKNCGFYGYIVEHKFRAKNNRGNVMFGDVIYILNKDKTEIVAAYDTADDDFLGFIQMVGAMQEIGENYNVEEIDLEEICDDIKSRFEL